MTLSEFNQLPQTSLRELLATTCGSKCWQSNMTEKFPFTSEAELVKTAVQVWYDACGRQDWIEAFSQHPKLGDLQSLAERFPTTSQMAGLEQKDVSTASHDILTQLSKANDLYEAKFEFIFIVFTTGKTAAEMLRILQDRSSNNYEEELIISMGEQLKITIQRLKQIISAGNWEDVRISQLTTHVQDTTTGKPAAGMTIRLKHCVNNSWYTLAQGVTNKEGRIGNFLPPGKNVLPGNYKMCFETFHYFRAQAVVSFYPKIEIDFTVSDDNNYHLPLSLSALGYATHRED